MRTPQTCRLSHVVFLQLSPAERHKRVNSLLQPVPFGQVVEAGQRSRRTKSLASLTAFEEELALEAQEESAANCMQRCDISYHRYGQLALVVALHTLSVLLVYQHFFTQKWKQKEKVSSRPCCCFYCYCY